MRKPKREIPTVYKSIFGDFYILSPERFTQQQLQQAYDEQQQKEGKNDFV